MSAWDVISPYGVPVAEWTAHEEWISRLLPGNSPQPDRPRLLNELTRYSQAITAEARSLGPLMTRVDLQAAEQWLRRPVFICGHHRSGTTLLQQLLDGHPQLLVLPSEATYLSFFRYVARPGPPARAVDRFVAEWICRLIDPNQAPHFKLGRSDPLHKPYLVFARRLLGWVEALRHHGRFACLLSLAAAYRDVASPGLSPARWVEKTPLNEHRMADLSSLEGAKFIHMVRHPAASLASLRERYRSSGADFNTARHIRSIGRSLEAACRNGLRHPRYLVVRYEDLTTAPAATMDAVRAFLGLAADERLLIPSVAGQAVSSNSSFDAGSPGQINRPRPIASAGTEARLISVFSGRAARELGYDIEVPHLLRRSAVRLRHYPAQTAEVLHACLRRISR